MEANTPQDGAGKKVPAAGNGFASLVTMCGQAAQAGEGGKGSNCRAGRATRTGAAAQSQGSEDVPPTPANTSTPAAKTNLPATAVSQVSSRSRRATSGSVPAAQTVATSALQFSSVLVSNQIPTEAVPFVALTQAVAGQADRIMPSLGENQVQSPGGPLASTAKVANEPASPQLLQGASALGSASPSQDELPGPGGLPIQGTLALGSVAPSTLTAQLNLSGETQLQAAHGKFPEASKNVYQEVNSSVAASLPSVDQTEHRAQSGLELQSAPIFISSSLTYPTLQLNTPGKAQTQTPYYQVRRISPEVYQDANMSTAASAPPVGQPDPSDRQSQAAPALASSTPPLVSNTFTYPTPQLNMPGRVQAQTPYYQFRDISPAVYQDANASTFATSSPNGLTDRRSQVQPQSAPTATSNTLSSAPARLDHPGSTQPHWASRPLADVSSAASAEPGDSEPRPSKLTVSFSSVQKDPQSATPSQTASASENQATESAVVPEMAWHNSSRPDAEPAAAPAAAQIWASQLQVLWNADPDIQPDSSNAGSTNSSVPGTSHINSNPAANGASADPAANSWSSPAQPQSANAGRAVIDAGLNSTGSISITPRGSAIGMTSSDIDRSKESSPVAPTLSSSAHSRSPENDKSASSDLAGNPPISTKAVPEAGNLTPTTVGGERPGGDLNSPMGGNSQNTGGDFATNGSPAAAKTAPIASAGQKTSPPATYAISQTVIDPSPAVKRGPDSQNGTESPSTASAPNAAPTLQSWDGARVSPGQQVSSAHLAEAMGRSDLQVDMKSDSWGPVSVHATLTNGQVGAEIQVSDHAARAALAEGLPALEKTLGDKGIQVVNIDVSRGLGFDHSQSQGEQPKHSSQSPYATRAYSEPPAIESDPAAAATAGSWAEDFVPGHVSVRV